MNKRRRESNTYNGDMCPLMGRLGVQATSPTYTHSCAKRQTCTHRAHIYASMYTHKVGTHYHQQLFSFLSTQVLFLLHIWDTTHLGTSTPELPLAWSPYVCVWVWGGRASPNLLGHFCSSPVSSRGFPGETPLQSPY